MPRRTIGAPSSPPTRATPTSCARGGLPTACCASTLMSTSPRRRTYLILLHTELNIYSSATTQGVGNERLNAVLRMASASALPQSPIEFVERPVKHTDADPQYALHVDTFHSVVKAWVYPANLTVQAGPMYYVPGSHRCSRAKLR